jgi:hypothetical protein
MNTGHSAARKLVPNVLGLSLLLLAAGCGSRGTVSGKVLYKGKPLTGGHVVFLHQKGSFTTAIQEDGSYSIDRVPSGPVKIAVTAAGPVHPRHGLSKSQLEKMQKNKPEVKSDEDAPKAMMAEMLGSASGGNKSGVNLPEKYGDPEKSGLTYTVAGGSQTYDIKVD